MPQLEYRLTSSLEKCFLDESPLVHPALTHASALRGETFSFQLVWRGTDSRVDGKQIVFFRVESPLAAHIHAASVESVPVRFPAYKTRYDENYLRLTPGLYPDLLVPADGEKQLYVVYNDTRALWLDVEIPADAAAGDVPVTVVLCAADGTEFVRATLTLTVVGASLPAQTLRHTEWFHADCLADYYRVPVWSEEHWRITENFIRGAAKRGVNMILTPVFTPPLDTAVGGERTTVQLVGVRRTAGVWSFDFARLGRWIDMLDRCGVEYIEIAHLFTQWGAEHAPKIIADVDGVTEKVFGWETDSLGEEYTGFLDAFLPALLAYLRERGVDSRCVFHVSDEPGLAHLERYRAVRAVLERHLSGYTIMDALSSFEFYKTGALDHPIPASNHIEPFLEANVPGLWTYYCCSQGVSVSNRFLAMPGARTRIIGLQMYKYRIEGFLQWGYNFYNSQYSVSHIDPYLCNDGEYFVPAGDAFSVYPAPDGTPYETLHYRQFAEGLSDMRAFALAESLIGRDAVLAILDSAPDGEITFSHYPSDAAYLLGVREKINAAIATALR